jgi:hypothetical protein
MDTESCTNKLFLGNVLKDFNMLEDSDGDGGERRKVPKIAGGAHPVEPRKHTRSIEWPSRSPMAAGRVHSSSSEPPAPSCYCPSNSRRCTALSARPRGRTLLTGCASNSGTLYPLSSLAILNPFLLMETLFKSGRNCSGLGGAAAGIESVVSVGELPVQHRLQKCSPAANRSQGQRTMLKTED